MESEMNKQGWKEFDATWPVPKYIDGKTTQGLNMASDKEDNTSRWYDVMVILFTIWIQFDLDIFVFKRQ
jgi:hypothetical protein